MRFCDEIRQKYPGLARKSDGGNTRAAIRLFCMECMGGQRTMVNNCPTVHCSLWRWRMGTGTEERPEGTYPPLPEKRNIPGAFGRGGNDDDDEEERSE